MFHFKLLSLRIEMFDLQNPVPGIMDDSKLMDSIPNFV